MSADQPSPKGSRTRPSRRAVPWRAYGVRLLLVALVVAAVLPFLEGAVWQNLAVTIVYYVMLVASWNLLAGYSGIFSFGHVAFAALGAYTVTVLMVHQGVPPPVAFVVSGPMCLVAGSLLGVLSTRINGPYFVVASFGFLVVVQVVILGNPTLTGGAAGAIVPDLLHVSSADRTVAYYVLGLGLAGAFLGLTYALLHWTRVGKVLASFRDDDDAAAALGLNPRHWKVGVFAYSAFWAGVAGAFFAFYTGFVTPGIGSVTTMSVVVAMGIVGGLGTFLGPIASTVGLQIVSNELNSVAQAASSLLFGVVLLLGIAILGGRVAGYNQIASVIRRVGRLGRRTSRQDGSGEPEATTRRGDNREFGDSRAADPGVLHDARNGPDDERDVSGGGDIGLRHARTGGVTR